MQRKHLGIAVLSRQLVCLLDRFLRLDRELVPTNRHIMLLKFLVNEILPLRKLRVRISPGGSDAAKSAQLVPTNRHIVLLNTVRSLSAPRVVCFYCLPFPLGLPLARRALKENGR